MTKEEFEKKIMEDGLIEVYDGDIKKIYIDSGRMVKNGMWVNNEINAYGCYEGKDGEFITFITDDERGISNWGNSYVTEDAAYNALYKKIARLNRIYKSKH